MPRANPDPKPKPRQTKTKMTCQHVNHIRNLYGERVTSIRCLHCKQTFSLNETDSRTWVHPKMKRGLNGHGQCVVGGPCIHCQKETYQLIPSAESLKEWSRRGFKRRNPAKSEKGTGRKKAGRKGQAAKGKKEDGRTPSKARGRRRTDDGRASPLDDDRRTTECVRRCLNPAIIVQTKEGRKKKTKGKRDDGR